MEFLDVVDDNDQVVGKAEYNEVYAKKLPHRIVHILLFNDKGEMALQMRSKNKSFCPLHWSTAVGGHVRSGETYEEAAKREFEEELGTSTNIEFVRKDKYHKADGQTKFLTTFKATFNGPFDVCPEEVDRVEFFSIDKIKQMILTEKFHTELLFLLKKEYEIQ